MKTRHLAVLAGAVITLATWSITGAQMGGMMNNGSGMMSGGQHGQAIALDTVTVSGTVLVDTLGFHDRYLLDENGDGEADDYLGFGPWWYKPENGATRPVAGSSVTVVGLAASAKSGLKMIMVLKINGQVWRDPNQAPSWMSHRLRRDAAGTTTIHSPGQGRGSMAFPEGSMMDMMGSGTGMGEGGMMGDNTGMMIDGIDWDEMYVHMEEISTDEVPNVPSGKRVVAAYRTGFANAIGEDMMVGRRMMEFSRPVEIRLGYDRNKVQTERKTGQRPTLMQITENGNLTEVTDASVDETSSEVIVAAKRVSSYYAIVTDQGSLPTAVESVTWGRIKGIFR
jgi:hypothetical protein